jgi:hypothetical protein
MIDFRNIEEQQPSNYKAGKHLVKFGKWVFDVSKKGKDYLQIEFEKGDSKKPFTLCRLYFSHEVSIGIAKHLLHQLCEKMGINYTPERVSTPEEILKIGDELKGREIEILLEPTGGQNLEKGYDYLGVNIPDVGEFYIKAKSSNAQDTYNQEFANPNARLEDQMNGKSDLPF